MRINFIIQVLEQHTTSKNGSGLMSNLTVNWIVNSKLITVKATYYYVCLS